MFFPGFRSDVPGIMRAVAQRLCLFVMPSAYEGFGIAPLEGFYFRHSALVSPAVPLREIAGDAAQVCPAEVGPMAEAIVRILSDQEAWREMSQSAQAVAERFSIKDHVTPCSRYTRVRCHERDQGVRCDASVQCGK